MFGRSDGRGPRGPVGRRKLETRVNPRKQREAHLVWNSNGNGGGPWGNRPGPGSSGTGSSDQDPSEGGAGSNDRPESPWARSGGRRGNDGGGRGPFDRNPFNRGPGGRGSGGRGPGGGGQPPDFDDFLRQMRDRFGGFLGGGLRPVLFILAGLVAIWMLTGFYRVQPDQRGVVLTFGRWTSTTDPGLNWHWPSPIQTVITPSVTRDNRTEIGFRSGPDSRQRDDNGDNLMLTGDSNIVEINFVVFWRIKDAGQFLFGTGNPEVIVRAAAESAMRETIGQTPVNYARTTGRGEIETRTQDLLQHLLDRYGAGVEIRQVQLLGVDPPAAVIDAFNEVTRAEQNSKTLRNEAESYRNDIIPRAQGEAERLRLEASAYKDKVVSSAQGDAQRFLSVLQSYRASPDVTTETLYLQTMTEILSRANKLVLDTNTGNGIVPYLPLPGFGAKPPSGTPPTTLVPPRAPAPPASASDGTSRPTLAPSITAERAR